MTREEEIAQLTDECLKKDGSPRKNCDLEKLKRLVELQAARPQAPLIVPADDDTEKLMAEYEKLKGRMFDEDGKLTSYVTEKRLHRFLVLKDMLSQPLPSPERASAKVLKTGKVEIKVKPGTPVYLEGMDDIDEWKPIAQIMPYGGKVQVPKDKYKQFRLTRGTDKTEYFTPPVSNPGPNKKRKKGGLV